ncbi:peptidylprolyl isomerase fpr4 [Kappamyces sp. JEL0829]|nr:peptidylprolyl isomerase fpr4 [Kappamyces sp. JEL0829]
MSLFPTNFFGLTVYPGKAYTTTLEDDVHITMAALLAELPKNAGRTSVHIKVEGNTYTLCSLTPGKLENQPINIHLSEGEEVTFSVTGACPVDLTGNNIVVVPPGGDDFDEEDEEDDGIDEELDSDEAELHDEDDEEELTEAEIAEIKKKLAELGDTEEFDDDDDDEDEDDDEEMEFDEALKAELLKRKAKVPAIPVNNKKAKITEIAEDEEGEDEEDDDDEEDDEEEEEEESKQPEPKKPEQKKPEQKKPEQKKAEQKKPEPSPEAKKEEPKNIKKLPSGLVMEDAVVGTGPRAKAGKKVSVRYIGKLMNGKVFDSNTKGQPFSFRLGKGEVIKGWDLGVQGMNVGGTRKLTIPAALAYGSRGAPPDIPKNADLQFEVKLLEVK